MDELGKSIGSFFKERTTGPLYGTFVFSWCVCNWKIIYLTLFVDADIVGNKLRYIEMNYLHWIPMILYPILATSLLIFVVPYAATEAYKASLKFRDQRQKALEGFESNTRLSVEESNAIRRKQEEMKQNFVKQIDEKNKEIKAQQDTAKLFQQRLDSAAYQLRQKEDEINRLNTFRILSAKYGDVVNGNAIDVTAFLNRQITDDFVTITVNQYALQVNPSTDGKERGLMVIFQTSYNDVDIYYAEEGEQFTLHHDGQINTLQEKIKRPKTIKLTDLLKIEKKTN